MKKRPCCYKKHSFFAGFWSSLQFNQTSEKKILKCKYSEHSWIPTSIQQFTVCDTFHAAQPKMLIFSALFTLCGTSETFPAKSWQNTRIFGRYKSLIQFSMQVFSDTCQRLLDAQRRIAQLEDQVNKETEVPRFRWLFWSCHHCSST